MPNVEDSIISTIRAITENNKINAEFSKEVVNFHNIDSNYFAAKKTNLLPAIGNHDLNQLRSNADLCALYIVFHSPSIHKQHHFDNSASQKLFEDLEKFRLIVKGGREFKGMAVNFKHYLPQYLETINSPFALLPFLLAEEILASNSAITKFFDKEVINKIKALSNTVDDQSSFAVQSSSLIDFLTTKSDSSKKTPQENNPQPKKNPKNDLTQNSENVEAKLPDSNQNPVTDKSSPAMPAFGQDNKILSGAPIEDQSLDSRPNQIKFIPQYKVFTKKYDQIIKAENLITKSELKNLSHQLDLKLGKLTKISHHLTSKLKRKLLAKKSVFYQYNKEEGLLDRKRISQIIAKPLVRNNYLTIIEDSYQNTILTILLDNSGSMRGTPIVMSAMASLIIAKIFESFGIKTEILGFTTVDWRGGKSRKLWEEVNRPKNPGRLSDLRHIIYKSANQSFKKSQSHLGLMLKDGILKENIDGEALMWAAKRLADHSQKRKILMVISDGTPVDDSTNSNNDDDILTHHLHQTINKIEKHSAIEISAIGIGHHVDDFYHNSITIKQIEELGDVMINKICDMI